MGRVMTNRDRIDGRAEDFEHERPRLLGLAYRITGSYADAEDAVQEAWLRYTRADAESIANVNAWLTTVTSRLALDRLRAQARQREDYVGPWLPEPVAAEPDPADLAAQGDSLTFGFLVLLDELSPVERVVFLLSEVFREPYSRIADTVGKSEAACRQIAHRARQRIGGEHEAAPRPADRALLEQLVHAIAAGDEDALVALLHPDVRLVSDGGPTRHAARRPVVGADRVSRLMRAIVKRSATKVVPGWRVLNGQDAFVLHAKGQADLVLLADERDGRIVAIRTVLNPTKLAHVDGTVLLR